MTTTKKHQVVMLPTNEKAKIGDNVIVKRNTTLAFGKKVQEPYNMVEEEQHLYILSDEEIKEGDWYENNGVIFRADDKFDEGNNPNQNKKNKKIITTTDKLETTDEQFHNTFKQYLPQPSQSFIELYVEEYNKGNVITEVTVEYHPELYDGTETTANLSGRLKINPKDNTITIHKVKDSWNREEVIGLIKKFTKDNTSGFIVWVEDFDNWFEKNL